MLGVGRDCWWSEGWWLGWGLVEWSGSVVGGLGLVEWGGSVFGWVRKGL